MCSTENDEATGNFYNLEKYDPYVEMIRALFVPSLEPRIYSCLETFVYHQDPGQSSDYSHARRCLDVAASNLRVPSDAFSTSLSDEGLLETILTHAIKFLIKDGLFDCFLNSIILNNRLNKICRDLDGLGIEKDFLKYLAVWNYINERDYWIESDQNSSRSVSEEFSDSQSDLDVEIGSRLCYYTNEKEGACSEDSENICDFSDIRDDNDETRRHVENWLGVNSIISKQSKTNAKMRQKSISRNFPCRPSNCPTYRLKNSCQNDWDGKILKLKLSEVCCSNSINDQPKSMKLSKLRLPCEFENVISKFTEADSVIFGLSSVTKKKKFRTALVNICRRINQLFSRIDKNEVRRCKLHCEKCPNYLSFKITKRESDGCKVCLLNDRLQIGKIEEKSVSGSRESSFGKLSQIMEDENSRDSDLSLCGNSQDHLDVGDFTKLGKSQAGNDVDLDLSETYLEPRKCTNSKRTIHDEPLSKQSPECEVGDRTCNCDTVDPLFDRTNPNNNNGEFSRLMDLQKTETQTILEEPIQEDSSKPGYNNSFEDHTCICNGSFNRTVNNVSNNPENESGADRNNESNPNQDIDRKLSLNRNSFHSVAFDDSVCPCNAQDSFDQAIENVPKDLLPEERSIHAVDQKIQSPEPSKALSSTPSGVRLQRRQTLQSKAFIDLPPIGSWVQSTDPNLPSPGPSKVVSSTPSGVQSQRRQTFQSRAFIDLPPMGSWVQSADSNLPSPEPSKDLAPQESSSQSVDPKIQTSESSKDQVPEASSVQLSDDKMDTRVCPCSFPIDKFAHRSDEKDRTVVSGKKSSEHPEKIISDGASTKQRVPNELSCIFDSKNVNDPIDASSFHMVLKNRVENNRESLKADLNRCKSFTKIPIHNQEIISYTAPACECPSDCTCANKEKPDDQADGSSCQYIRDFPDDQGPSKLLNPPIKKPLNQNVSNHSPEMRYNGSMIPSCKIESNSIETQVDSKKFRIPAGQGVPRDFSCASLNIPAKETSRSFHKMERNAIKCFHPDEGSKINEPCEKSVCECGPLLSTQFPRPKSQRINISIELCPESDGSINKIKKRDKKGVRTLHIDSKNLRNFQTKESRTLSSLGQLKCQSVDLHNREIGVNQPLEKNTKDEWPCETNSRVHSPAQPLESRDYLPPVERVVSSMRNTSVYENPIKPGLRSNRKFVRRSMSQSKRIHQDYETRGFHEPIRNNCCWGKNIKRQMRSRGSKDSSRSPQNSARFSSSFVNGHLCHAFSSSSIDRMRHLIKTKLRRILLERDKSTNTPKTSLTNKKYRVSFPNGKTTERLPFQRKCCRTIWESHSASDSTPASRSFVSENRIGIHEGAEMCQLLYCSSKRSKKSSSNFESISRDSDFSKNDTISIDSRSDLKKTQSNDYGEIDFMKERPVRLAGGSDSIPKKKTNSRPRFSRTRNENPDFPNNPEKKLFAHSKNCDLPENFENYSDPLDSQDGDSEVVRKENQHGFVACSGKLDSSLKSTSRHIYFYEFLESPNDELFDSNLRVKKKRQSASKVRFPEIREDQIEKKVKIKESVYGKNGNECQKRSTPNRDDHSRGTNALNNASRANTTSLAHKGFNYLDSDLRTKLSQYVSLCKNVKYSLLKRLRPNDAYEVSGTSISCGDHL